MKFSLILFVSLYVLAYFNADARLLRSKQDAVSEHENKRMLDSHYSHYYPSSSKSSKGKGKLCDPLTLLYAVPVRILNLVLYFCLCFILVQAKVARPPPKAIPIHPPKASQSQRAPSPIPTAC